MKLSAVTIRNFRGISNITIEFDKPANVIVGPNAIGKTTVLEAIRLAKAVLASRVGDEGQQAFISLGAQSPHNLHQFNYGAVCGDETQPLSVAAMFDLTNSELNILDELVADLGTAVVRASLGQPAAVGQLALVQYLSTPGGADALTKAKSQVEAEIAIIKGNPRLRLNLTVDPITQTIRGGYQLEQLIFASLEARLPPNQALFSYFPADRALPLGDINNIIVGGADVNLQLHSHNAQPQSKYARLKSTIISNRLLGTNASSKQEGEFKKIFSSILKDRELIGISIDRFGFVSIKIRQIADGKIFDIDAMSSGEKGLILTFLLISSSVSDGGIILIDEPELHLNPAVCKLLLPFLLDEYLIPKNIQAIICSHSPELLGSAFDRTDCSLHHLQSPTVISKIYPEDKREVFDALRRLGTSASDVLFSSGSVFVEGEHDIEILEAGFSKLLGRYKVTHLGGRGPVEREIKTLQDAERKNEIDTLKCFIFDLDGIPTSLTSSNLVRVLQWKRRCLENFLIDEKIIYDLLKEKDVANKAIPSRGEVPAVFKQIAISQLQGVVMEKVYASLRYDNSGFRPKEVAGKTYTEAAEVLFDRISAIQSQVCGLDRTNWRNMFEEKCVAGYDDELPRWEVDWLTLCDGKRFFRDLRSKYEVRLRSLKFKKLIVERMEKEQSAGWLQVEKTIADAIHT
jgi:predicted ATPase